MSSFIALRKTLDLSADNNRHLLVGRQNRDLPQVAENGAVVTTLKKHYDMSVDVQFDSNGGTACDGMTYVLGSTYKGLPVPTKAQHIFNGWATATGQILTDSSLVELSNTTLTAQWEYVDIGSDCTEYIVQCNSSYKNTGIYAANRYSSTSAVYVDWGDGNVEKVDGNISKLSHSYTNAGTYSVKVSNNLTSFAPSYNDSTWYNTTSQNRYTFKGMTSTSSRVTSLPSYAFYYCQAMTNIDFMQTCWSTVTSLPSYCFYYCSGLTSIQGAKRFTSLGSQCFRYCSGLTGIQDLSEFKFTTLPNSYTFAECANVTQWILPDVFNGTSFGSYMFDNNNSLVGIGNIEKTINQIKVVQIDYLEGNGGIINIEHIPTLNTSMEFEMMPLSYTGYNYIGFPYELANYNDSADFRFFVVSSSEMYFDFANQRIGPKNVNFNINTWYTIRCYNNGVTINGTTYTGSTATNAPYNCPIYIFGNNTTGAVNFKLKYLKIYENNQLVQDLIPVRIGNIGYMYDKVSGKLFENQRTGNFILGPDKENTEEIIIEQEIMVSKLPESLTSIGSYTFNNCSKLNNLIIPSKVQSIGNYAFYGCTSLNNVNIEATNLTAINQYAFYNCNKLADLDLPDTVKTIGNYAFYGCTSLNYAGKQNTELPSQLTSIGSYAYQGCNSLKSLNSPENLQTIGDYAFAGCYQISSIVDKRLTAQTVSTNTFGSSAGTSYTAFTGYQTKGNNILCTYVAATGYDDGYWNDPLQNPTKCGFNIQYIDPENLRYCTISFDAGEGTVSEASRQIVYGRKIGELPKPTCPADKPYFGGWYTEANGVGTKYTAGSTAPSKDSLTLYAFYSAVQLKSYTVDLNGQWRQSTAQTNPDSTLYDGVYESNSNYNVGSGFAKMYVRIGGYDEFTIYIRSYGESSYDYTLAFNPDVDVTSNPSYSTSGVKAHTRGNQQSGQAIGNYTKVTYTDLGGGDHFICIIYRKDSSVNSGNDRGYVLIPKDQ